MKRFYFLFIFLLFIAVYSISVYALTPEEVQLLKKAGVSDEKISEMQKKEGTPSAQAKKPILKINPFDWDGDGKKDIIAGSDSGQVYVYLNTGTNQEPLFDKAIEIFGVKVIKYSKPFIVDWNNDGKKDVLVGAKPGTVSIFINKGENLNPVFADEIKLNDEDLDVGFNSSPVTVDWNADGKKDILAGSSSGKVFIFLNKGNDAYPRFLDDEIKTSIRVTGYARPFIVDWNGDGKFDVICGSSDGKIYIFINEGDIKFPKFGNALALQVNNEELKLPSPASVIALDWNDDGKTDLVVSNKENEQPRIYLLLNTGTREKPEFKELKPIKGKFRDDTVL
ncbi:MAG: VCBS repeat-containing protein [Nitrospirota bacterium]